MAISRRDLVQGAAVTAGVAAVAAPGLLRAQGQPIRVGVMYGLSGAGAVNGQTMLKGTQIAAAQVNKAGGLLGRQIELVVRDDKFTGAGAIAAGRELSGAGVNLLIGGSQTVTALALIPLLQEVNAVMAVPAAAGMAITHEGFSRHAFRTCANAYIGALSIGRAVAEKFPNVLKWQAIVPDNAFGRDAGKLFNNAVRQYHARRTSKDFEVRDLILISAAQTDFRTQINTLMSSGVEGVFCAAVGAAEVAFFQQARAVGLDKKLKVMADLIGDLLAKSLGRDMPASFWGPSYWPYQADLLKSNKVSQQLYKDYVAMTGDPHPASLVNLGYRGAQALFEGIRKANATDTAAVIKAMEGLTFESVSGPYRIRKEDHQGLGHTFVANYMASPTEPFFAVKSVQAVSEESVVESPSPGAEYVI